MASKRSSVAGPESQGDPKLPKVVADLLPAELVNQIEKSATDDLEIKVYNFAKRFEKHPDELEMYWDAEGPGELRVERKTCDSYEVQVEVVSCDSVADEVQKRMEKLLNDGFQEFELFHKAHKVHRPCFVPVVEKEIPKGDFMSSRFCTGSDLIHKEDYLEFARYKEESIEDFEQYSCWLQINLSTLPRRAQAIVGKSGLLQFLHLHEEDDCEITDGGNVVRIIPEEDFPMLVSNMSVLGEDDTVESKKIGITKWLELRDYPSMYPEELSDDMEDFAELNISSFKIGGYAQVYDPEANEIERKPCEHCGEGHMFANYSCNSLCFDEHGLINGTVCFSMCPNTSPLVFSVEVPDYG